MAAAFHPILKGFEDFQILLVEIDVVLSFVILGEQAKDEIEYEICCSWIALDGSGGEALEHGTLFADRAARSALVDQDQLVELFRELGPQVPGSRGAARRVAASTGLEPRVPGRLRVAHFVVVCISYSQDLAESLALSTRTVMKSSWYRRLFPNTRLSSEKNTAAEMQCSSRS